MRNFIVETYSNASSLEQALNERSDKYFPIRIIDTYRAFTVIYCKKDIMCTKQMKDDNGLNEEEYKYFKEYK